ncbi:Gfo/Idh/MocA family oxidoreductase [Micromonospora andamanensis]|uniref:Gfo/Idh/MocA-like oxidoreductase N-terminal domain-containing protein n=1 Tax=Micromonospora andamanensis TaxID=1287068 RepID=A0ABQ4I1S4_9ACTN|nr:Gfo/Idh/MocA family oxidoreductase [Micromonospora andamanensis]GIJ11802.1 hypothetical protein Van01_50160 [Micromonospora andamanensis]GIJ38963.1 hypothetical protein Vwe01_22880 [Micromonospora andamanensis]
MQGDLQPVIVGYGRAGRDLHHRALRPFLDPHDTVIVVDPRPVPAQPGIRWVATLAEAARALHAMSVPMRRAVFHLTTPPAAHLAGVEHLVALGARQVILEKPIATSVAEARRIADLSSDIAIMPVSVWLESTTTAVVERAVAAGEVGRVTTLHMEQSKPRFRRNLAATDAHTTPFDVELPHQMLLALHLAGADAAVESAVRWPMSSCDKYGHVMGGAAVTLTHGSAVTSTLLSDLTAPIRRRRLVVTGTHGQIVADYPLSSEDDYGQVRIRGRGDRQIVRDLPLSQFVRAAYDSRRGASPPPRGDLGMHVRSIELLDQARSTAVTIPPQVTLPQPTEFASWHG